MLVSVGLIWYLLTKVSFIDALDRASSLPVLSLLGAFAFVFGYAILGIIRWRCIIIAVEAKLEMQKAVLISFVSLFFNQFLPASIGADLVRIWQSSRAGLPFSTAMTTVMLDRFSNLLSVVAMTLVTLPALTHRLVEESTQGVFILLGVAGGTSLVVLMFLDRLPERWRCWRLVRGLALIAHDTRAIFLKPRYASVVLITSVAGQVALSAAVWLLAVGLGLNLRFVDCLIVMPPIVLISALPISVAGWGVRELAMVSALGMLAVPQILRSRFPWCWR